jgi:PAS domain S-box-containing protein
MAENKMAQIDSVDLQRLAEDRLGVSGVTAPPVGTWEESLRLIHELQAHRIELEMQNEELRHTRDTMNAALEKCTSLYDLAPAPYLVLDRAGIISSVNIKGSGLLKIERSLLIGRRFVSLVPVETRHAFACFLEKVFNGQAKEACESALITEGAPRFLQIEAVAVLSGEECLLALIDITERKHAEEAMILKNIILTSQMNSSINGILVVDDCNKMILLNNRFVEMWGIPAELVEAEDDVSILQHVVSQMVETECFLELIRYLFEHKEEKSRDEITLKDGRIFDRYSTPVTGADGKYYGREWNFHDITELKRIERVKLVCMDLLKSSSTLLLDELLQTTLDKAEELTGSVIGFYHFLEADQKTLALQGWSTRTKADFCMAEGHGLHYNVSEAGAWVDCIHQRRPVIHNDYATLRYRKGLPSGHAPVVRELVVPVFRDDRIVAILGIGNKPHDYTQLDVQVISLLADLTWEFVARKKAEDNLLKSEARYRSLVTATSQIIWTTNAAGEVVDDCPSMRAFSGQSAEEMMGFGWSNAIHPDDIQRTVAVWKDSVETHSVYHVEYRMRRHDGEYRNLSARGVPVIGQNGTIREWVGTCTDITEFKEASRKIRASEMRYRRLFESAKDGILIIDAETGRIVDVNLHFCELLGISSDELIGRYHWDIGLFQNIEAAKNIFKPLKENAYVRYENLPLPGKDGLPIEVECVSNTYLVDDITMIQCTFRDITEHRKLEAQLHNVQKMEAIGQLAGGIAHDFNNILTVIIGFGSILDMQMSPDDPLRNNVSNILTAADRAANLTKSLLTFSRKQPSDMNIVGLNSIVQGVEKLLHQVLRDDIECRMQLAEEEMTIFADSGQIDQILLNLATNARDAMPDGGELTICTMLMDMDQQFLNAHGFGALGHYAVLSVTDTGQGMDEATRKKIFEPFFTTKEIGKGTGLGLAMVFGIIKQHHGFVTCYSEPGIGSTLNIYLPLQQGMTEQKIMPDVIQPVSGSETILLAEDEEMVRTVNRIILEEAGYRVIEAVNGCNAVQQYMDHRNEIKLLLFDLIMPKKNGIAAYHAIQEVTPQIRVIFTSGYAADIANLQELSALGFECIAKPVQPAELLNKVRAVLDHQGGLAKITI